MSKESIPQHNARALEEEQKHVANKLAEHDTIRRCDAEATATALKHEQKIATKNLEHTDDQAKQNAKNLKDEAKANAEKLKL
ncbi:unnamed protein product [Rotaria sordida]|uniref:Uncharacterized protein n=1 Tax=Rotaria sordida TaxID=392033 RepID=A0A815GWM2_9BILA|nr:unnamed protein product [Rotaria sordida]CAF1346044.1 unnamed protein product [Rotaria sordida]CAF1347027.1 unnamed protein product [Rotaria sordida]CAF1347313.1 unnamed protein product [Rotaria sordida]CAF1367313.1 unnamed protein product [Rotaria sordida]